jgi:hypothetical protein
VRLVARIKVHHEFLGCYGICNMKNPVFKISGTGYLCVKNSRTKVTSWVVGPKLDRSQVNQFLVSLAHAGFSPNASEILNVNGMPL